jgi:hypothetical protein
VWQRLLLQLTSIGCRAALLLLLHGECSCTAKINRCCWCRWLLLLLLLL